MNVKKTGNHKSDDKAHQSKILDQINTHLHRFIESDNIYSKIAKDHKDYCENFYQHEDLSNFSIGGYHPAFQGEILNQRYVLIKKIGTGMFAHIWLSRDLEYDIFVAIKIHKSAPYYLESAFDETEMFQLMNKKRMEEQWQKTVVKHFPGEKNQGEEGFHVNLLNSFVHFGPNGNHFCMVMELLGPSLASITKKMSRDIMRPKIYERVVKQVLLGQHFLHDYCNIIHTDIKAENVMLSLPLDEMEKIVEEDLENIQMIKSKLTLELRKKYKMAEFAHQVQENVQKVPLNLTKKQKKQLKKKQKKKEKNKKNNNVNVKETAEPTSNDLNAAILIQENKQIYKEEEQYKDRHEFDRHLNKYSNENLNNNSVGDTNLLNNNIRGKNYWGFDNGYDNEPCSKKSKSLPTGGNHQLRVQKDAIQHPFFSSYTDDQNPKYNFANKALFCNSSADKTDSKEKTCPSSRKAKSTFSSYQSLFIKNKFDIKIIDFSNACYVYHHFSKKITTRPNRSPEILLGIEYDQRTDIWSAACQFVQLLIGENLFNPKKTKSYSKNDDHLAQIIELLGKFPSNYINAAPKKKKFFDKNHNLCKINSQKYMDLETLLIQKYKLKPLIIEKFIETLDSMFQVMIKDRPNARDLLYREISLGNMKSLFMNDIEWKNYVIELRETQNLDNNVNSNENITILDNNNLYDDGGIEDNEKWYLREDYKTVSNDAGLQTDLEDLENSSEGQFFEFDPKDGMKSNYSRLKHIDRSFIKGDMYLGYDEGIDPNTLDLIDHLQFKPKTEILLNESNDNLNNKVLPDNLNQI